MNVDDIRFVTDGSRINESSAEGLQVLKGRVENFFSGGRKEFLLHAAAQQIGRFLPACKM